MNITIKRTLSYIIAAVLVAVLGCFVAQPAQAASGTISGSITCFYGNNNVSGVWVDAGTGRDGYATLQTNPNGGKYYSYSLSQTSNYRLFVGCSGTSSNWGSSMQSPWVNGNYYDWVCSYSNSMGYYCALS